MYRVVGAVVVFNLFLIIISQNHFFFYPSRPASIIFPLVYIYDYLRVCVLEQKDI